MQVDKYVDVILRKELEYEIDRLIQIERSFAFIESINACKTRRLAFEELYRRAFGESYVSKSKETPSDSVRRGQELQKDIQSSLST